MCKCKKTILLVIITLSLSRISLSLETDDFKKYYEQAEESFKEKKYSEAIELYNNALELSPNNRDVLFRLATLYAWTKKYNESEVLYKKILEINPQDIEGKTGYAALISWQGKFKEAIEIYEEVIKINPNAIDARIGLGRVYSWNKEYDKGIAIFKSILATNPEHEEAALGLADSYKWREDFLLENEINEKRKAAELDKGNIQSYLSAQRVYNWQNKLEEAIIPYKQLLSVNPSSIEAYNGIGKVYFLHGKWNEAIEAYNNTLQIEPSNLAALNGIEEINREKSPEISIKTNFSREKEYDLNLKADILELLNYSYYGTFLYKIDSTKTLKSRVKYGVLQEKNLFFSIINYKVNYNTVSLELYYGLEDELSAITSFGMNNFLNDGTNLYLFKENSDWGISFFVALKKRIEDHLFSVSFSREPFVQKENDLNLSLFKQNYYGIYYNYRISDYFNLFAHFEYTNYSKDTTWQDYELLLLYRLPFFEAVRTEYQYNYRTYIFYSTHKFSLVYQTELIKNILAELKYTFGLLTSAISHKFGVWGSFNILDSLNLISEAKFYFDSNNYQATDYYISLTHKFF